jgi:hypothetical protein
MLTKEKITTLLREKYPYLVAEYGVKKIGLFGSYAQGTPHEASDIDLVVEFQQPLGFRFIEFTEYLEEVFGQKVEVLTLAGIQGIRLAHVAEDIRNNIVYVSES